MATRTMMFDSLPEVEIELDLNYLYSFTPGRYNGPPENCYPDETEMEITLPANYEQLVVDAYMSKAREAIRVIEGRVEDFETEELPREWAAEDRQGYLESRSDEYDEERRLRRC